jgi:ABC-type phosphate/phosphonate transport system ATPase subunit
MIKLDNVSLVFEGGSVALSNVSTEISEGNLFILLGILEVENHHYSNSYTKTILQQKEKLKLLIWT